MKKRSKTLGELMKKELKSTDSSAQEVASSKRDARIRLVVAIATAAALYYAASSVVGYFQSVERLKEADEQSARIIEELRRDQAKPLVDEK